MAANDFQVDVIQLNLTITMLFIILLVGSIGNSIIIYVYNRKDDDQTATFFILVLAAADLIVCVIVIPFTISMELLNFRISLDVFCKAYYFLNISNITFSSLVISAVALDRYLCICHPMRRILTVSRAKIVVMSLVAISIVIATLAAINVGVHESYEYLNVTKGSTINRIESDFFICEETMHLANVSAAQKVFSEIVQHMNMACFLVCILSVIVFYSLVFNVILRVREKNKTLVLKNYTPAPSEDIRMVRRKSSECEKEHSSQIYESTMQADDNTKLEIIECEHRRPTRRSFNGIRKMSYRLRDSEVFQNFRSAGMLFVVAVVYILVFSPGILMAYNVISINLPIFYLYYFNNASNPLIYSFMNRGFRQELKKIFLRNRFMRKHFPVYSNNEDRLR